LQKITFHKRTILTGTHPKRTAVAALADVELGKMTRITKNITIAVSHGTYRKARVWAAKHDTSVSEIVETLLDYLPGVVQAFHELRKKYPDFESRGRTAD